MSSKPIIVLKSSQDWDEWFFIVQSRAKKARVFNYIDPTKDTRPQQPIAPTKPPLPTGTITDAAREEHKWKREDYKEDKKEYDRQMRELNDLSSLIEDSVSQPLLPLLRKIEDSHPYAQLRALQARLQPSVSTQQEFVLNKLRELEKPPTAQGTEKWLTQWEECVFKARSLGLSDVEGSRGVNAFLKPIMQHDSEYASPILRELRLGTKTLDVSDVIVDYREHARQKQALTTNKTRTTFAATLRGDEQPKKPLKCLCGDYHWYYLCFYLNPNAPDRPADFKPNKKVQDKILKLMKNDKIKAQVETALKRGSPPTPHIQGNKQQKGKGKEPKPNAPASEDNSDDEQGSIKSFAAIIAQSFVAQRDSRPTTLELSWIADTGTTHHVCNKYMRKRFTKTRNAGPEDFIICGTTRVPVKSFGNATVNTSNGKTSKVITLRDVAYVPTFMGNLVSIAKCNEKGVHMDTKRPRLYKDNTTVCVLTPSEGQFFLELHRAEPLSAITSAAATRSLPAEQWHGVFAHANHHAIKALPTAVTGATFTNSVMPTHCDVCARAKAHQLIARDSSPEEARNEPFFRVSSDLIQMTPAYNQHEWITHIECTKSNYAFTRTHVLKSDCNTLILDILSMIERRFDALTALFRTDGERSLNTAFKNELKRRGITLEVSAPYTPAQNGHAERTGYSIVIKARAMRIGANLPERLWPETVLAATYIHNRTPSKALKWKTPFELAHGTKPNVAHMRVYGCKAYALNKTITRSDKLQERALVGYLIGYDSTNIYRIWYPPGDRIIRTRDVTFDESSKYSPDEQEDYYDIEEAEEEPQEVVPRILLHSEDLIASDSSSSEDEEVTHAQTAGVIEQSVPSPDGQQQGTPPNEPDEQQPHLLTPLPSTRDDNTPQPPGDDELPSSYALSDPPTLGGEDEEQQQERRLGRLLPVQYDTEPDPGAARGNRAPLAAHINADPNPNLIIEGPRTRRGAAHAAKVITNAHCEQTFLAASMSAILTTEYTSNLEAQSTTHENPPPSYQLEELPPLPRIHRDDLPPEPRYYKDILKHQLKPYLFQALYRELKEGNGKGVWVVVDEDQSRKANKEVIPLTWVFKYKFDEKGYLTKVKARVCVRGDLQVSYQDTYAATLAFRIFRTLMAIVCAFDLEMWQYDVVNAFPHVPLDQPTFCKAPEGMTLPHGKILLLKKALYGLKESPALWQKHFQATLKDLGLEPVPDAPCLYANEHLFVFFFVDDIIMAFAKKDEAFAHAFEQDLFQRYEMRKIGEVQWFLALRIVRDRNKGLLWLSQESYLTSLKAKYNVKESSVATPLPAEDPPTPNDDAHATPQDIHTYQSKMGSAQFAAISTRPDIGHACSALSAYLTNPSKRHLYLAQRLLEYLVNTKDLAIVYQADVKDDQRIFVPSSDASFANDAVTRRSYQGSLMMLFGGPVDWKASKQPTVTTSTTEAELLALSETAKQAYWWRRFFRGIQFEPGHLIQIECDNTQTLRLMEENVGKLVTKLRHVDIHHHWLRQEAQAGNVHFKWTPTAQMIADGLTKPLSKQKHAHFVHGLGLSPLQQ
ncbi:Integrase catalytic core [Macrophomina phaseolina MS6]|uniref:Integrase catalytic core n=1 Tax=Macrophomina phaseolina (strain MS6) TaxID=1126212 RepID=K2QHY2_MACPH|nr:Integrase catalytic core [Macrophomina phaseolina MS6]